MVGVSFDFTDPEALELDTDGNVVSVRGKEAEKAEPLVVVPSGPSLVRAVTGSDGPFSVVRFPIKPPDGTR